MQTAVIQSWLETQCGQISGAMSGVVMLMPRNSHSLAPAATWPNAQAMNDDLAAAAKQAFDIKQPVAQPRLNGHERPEGSGPVISLPLQVKGKTVGAMAVMWSPDATFQPQMVLDRIRSKAETFEQYMRQTKDVAKPAVAPPAEEQADAAAALRKAPAGVASSNRAVAAAAAAGHQAAEALSSNSVRVLQLLATVEAHPTFSEGATAFVTELAILLQADRVSIGFSGTRHAKVEAISYTPEFRSNQSLLRDIGAAMQEAIWQGATLMHPQAEGQPRVTRAHADLVQRHGAAAVCSVPLVKAGKAFGALTLERTRAEPLSRTDVTLCENIGALLGPLLEMKRTVNRPWPRKLGAALREAVAPLFGPGHLGVKLAVGLIVAAVAAAALIDTDYRVSAPARLEGSTQRVMVAAGDGYLKQVHVRPGDRVKTGQLLAELADEDLRLERRKAESEIAQLENAFGDALTKRDRAQIAIQTAKLAEARSQLALIEHQLSRVQLRAPFDGVVISGDLTQSLGAPVKKGEVLITLAPERDFRVILEVDERDVGEVKVGEHGSLALAALPGDPFSFKVQRVTPVAAASEGRNYFEVEAQLDSKAGDLRPGLRGIGKIEAGTRSVLWIATHRFWDWLRLTAWSWVG